MFTSGEYLANQLKEFFMDAKDQDGKAKSDVQAKIDKRRFTSFPTVDDFDDIDPQILRKTKVFGTPVDTVMKRKAENGDLPKAIELLLSKLKVATSEKKLFFRTASKKVVNSSVKMIDLGVSLEFLEHKKVSIVEIASIFVKYILSFSQSPVFQSDADYILNIMEKEQIKECAEILKKINSEGTKCLMDRLLRLLRKFVEMSETNLMDEDMLAPVFAPFFFGINKEDPQNKTKIENFVGNLIMNNEKIFPEKYDPYYG